MQSSVLVLNRLYMAVQVMSVRRAFCLLFKDLAEVISVENGAYISYNFHTWREASEWKAAVEGRKEHEDRKSTRLNSSHIQKSRMPSSA